MKEIKQGGKIHTVKFAYWTSMFSPSSPCFILKKMAWIQTNKDFFFLCPKGNDIILFVYCTKGLGKVYYNDDTFTLSPGQALIFNISDGYFAKSISDDFCFIWIQMCGTFPNAVLSHQLKDRGHVCSAGNDIILVCEKIYDTAHKGWSYEGDIKISYYLYELFGTLLLSLSRDNSIEAAVDYMRRHYMEAITTPQLASLCYLGTSQFIKRFRESFSVTPRQYLTNLRIDKAKKLLMNADLPVSMVAHHVGFEDASYFTRIFKKATRQTPHNFRKNFFIL